MDAAADGSDPPTLMSVTIEPSEVELLSTNGSTPTQEFTVVATYSDSSIASVPITYTLDTPTIGTFEADDLTFTANGLIGGTVLLTARASPAVAAVAEITVRLEGVIVGEGLPPSPETMFATDPVDDASRAADVVYPLEGAVMPQNVYPPNVQWLNSEMNDVFRIRLEKPHATVTAYVGHASSGFTRSWQIETGAWFTVVRSDPAEDLTITVDRYHQATTQVVSSTPITITLARGALTGSVYYWDIEAGRIVRIDDGTATPTEFMPEPPLAIGGNQCVGCHSVSNSGNLMVGRLGGGNNIGAVFDLTTDLTGDPPPTVFPISTSTPTTQWWFSSWSPDDSRVVVTQGSSDLTMAIMDPLTGTILPVTGTLPTAATLPAWSPDGTAIAYVSGANAWGGALTSGSISLLEVTGVDTFGAVTTVHNGPTTTGVTPAGSADSYPTWTLDSQRIAFAHGNSSRSENGQAALYIMSRDGTSVVRLNNACGVDTTNNFQPRFSPFDQAGYYWMSFLSRRDYGNSYAGTRGTDYQQIWVTAIRKDAAPGEDPSEVPYWIAGQRTNTRNIAAYWAPRACREDGDVCTLDSECCGELCAPDPESGELVCTPPPDEACRMLNETCTTSADCCDDLDCVGNVCIDDIF